MVLATLERLAVRGRVEVATALARDLLAGFSVDPDDDLRFVTTASHGDSLAGPLNSRKLTGKMLRMPDSKTTRRPEKKSTQERLQDCGEQHDSIERSLDCAREASEAVRQAAKKGNQLQNAVEREPPAARPGESVDRSQPGASSTPEALASPEQQRGLLESVWDSPGGKLVVVGAGLAAAAWTLSKVLGWLHPASGESTGKESDDSSLLDKLLGWIGVTGKVGIVGGGLVGVSKLFGGQIWDFARQRLGITGDISESIELLQSGEITAGVDALRNQLPVPAATVALASRLGMDARALTLLAKTDTSLTDFLSDKPSGLVSMLSSVSGITLDKPDPAEEQIRRKILESLDGQTPQEKFGWGFEPTVEEVVRALDDPAQIARIAEEHDTPLLRLQETVDSSMPLTTAVLARVRQSLGAGEFSVAIAALSELPAALGAESLRAAVNVTGAGALEITLFGIQTAVPAAVSDVVPFYFSFVRDGTSELIQLLTGQESASWLTGAAASVMAVTSTAAVLRAGVTNNPLRPFKYTKNLLRAGLRGATIGVVADPWRAYQSAHFAPDAMRLNRLRLKLAGEYFRVSPRSIPTGALRSMDWHGRRLAILQEMSELSANLRTPDAKRIFEEAEQTRTKLSGMLRAASVKGGSSHVDPEHFAKEAQRRNAAGRFEVRRLQLDASDPTVKKVLEHLQTSTNGRVDLPDSLRARASLTLPRMPDVMQMPEHQRATALQAYARNLRAAQTRASAVTAGVIRNLKKAGTAGFTTITFENQLKSLDRELTKPLARAHREAVVAMNAAYRSLPRQARTPQLRSELRAALYNPDGTFTSRLTRAVGGRVAVSFVSGLAMLGISALTGPERDLHDTLAELGPESVQLLLDTLPGVGTYTSFYAAFTGETSYSKEDRSGLVDRGLSALFGVIGGAADIAMIASLGAAMPATIAMRVGVAGARLGLNTQKITRIKDAIPQLCRIAKRMGWRNFAGEFGRIARLANRVPGVASGTRALRRGSEMAGKVLPRLTPQTARMAAGLAPTALAVGIAPAYSLLNDDNIELHPDLLPEA